jgi:hypothetical protein
LADDREEGPDMGRPRHPALHQREEGGPDLP